MPRLPDVTALGERPIPSGRRPIVGDQSGEIEATAFGRLGETIGQIGVQLDERQSNLELTQARSALIVADIKTRQSFQDDQDWQSYEQRYRDRMGSSIETIGKSIANTRARQLFQAQAQVDLARGSAAMSEEAQKRRIDLGHANTVDSLDALRTSALQAGDQSTRAAAVGAAHQLIDASVINGDMTSEQGAVLKKQWTASYSEGSVQMLPYDRQIELLSKPKGTSAEFIAPDKREEMLQHAILAKQVEEERAARLLKEQQEQQQKAIQNSFLQKMTDGALTPQDVLQSNLAPFGSGSKDEFLNMLRAESKGKTDPVRFNELFARIHLPDGTSGKITNDSQLNQYFVNGQLSLEDLQKLRNEVQGQNTAAGSDESKLKTGVLEVAKNSLTTSNPLLGIRDPVGEENLQRFTSWFLEEYAKQRTAGKSAQQLLNPQSPDYLGRQISAYVRTPQEIMQDTIQSATGAPATSAPARKSNESADDYLKRIGKQ